MAKPTKQIITLENSSGARPELITNCLCLEVMGTGHITLMDINLNPYPACSKLLIRDITKPDNVHTLGIEVGATLGTSFVHVSTLGWYPVCEISPTFWLGEAVSPVCGRVYPYENLYAVAQAGNDEKRIPNGLEPLALDLEVTSGGTTRIEGSRFAYSRLIGPAEPVTGAPDAYAILFGVVGGASLTVQFTGLSAAAPAVMQAPITISAGLGGIEAMKKELSEKLHLPI